MIQLQNISAGYGGPLVVQDVSLDLNPGEVLVLLGPNGCGKSTLLKVIAGLQPPAGGQVLVDGQPAARLTRRQLAQKVTYLPQSRSVPNITAYRMVLHGRFPYLSYPRRYRPEDHAAAHVRRTLEGQLPESLEPILDWLEDQREAGKDALPPSQRRRWFSRLLSAALEAGRPLNSQETESLLRQFCEEELP